MARCADGHESRSTDYCDTCGSVITEPGPASPGPRGGGPDQSTGKPATPAGIACPNCEAINLPDSLFCEACGYDFTTGSMPRVAATGSWLDIDAPVSSAPGDVGQSSSRDESASAAPTAAANQPDVEKPSAPVPSPSLDLGPEPDPAAGPVPRASMPRPSTPHPSTPQSAGSQSPEATRNAPLMPETPRPEARRPEADTTNGPVAWVAELWIDPEWYAVQESPDPIPSPGLPDIVPLRGDSVLIGRTSHSRGIFPDIEGGADTGISRRQAKLTTDGKRWFVEDLDSSNGTFVGPAAGKLPEDPLTPGRRHELEPSDRIYVGAWTRIVLRRATAEEARAAAGRMD